MEYLEIPLNQKSDLKKWQQRVKNSTICACQFYENEALPRPLDHLSFAPTIDYFRFEYGQSGVSVSPYAYLTSMHASQQSVNLPMAISRLTRALARHRRDPLQAIS